ncbi:PepSY domain-containing protein [Streptomyces sp. NPDC059740]|uniref:PepSY domain-containing protein n=1 Tax=Streptomyces sp. NPDC059740 TaxID=3346926 RepID=UPI00365C4594
MNVRNSVTPAGPTPSRPLLTGARGARTAGLLAAGMLLGGCATGTHPTGSGASTQGAPAASASASPSGELTEDQRERKALVPAAKVSERQATRIATRAVPHSRLVSIELDRGPGGRPSWQTEVATDDGVASHVRVNAVSGDASRPRRSGDEDADDRHDLAHLLSRARISPDRAAAVATDHTRGTVTALELDDEDHKGPAWSVDVVSPHDWRKTTYDIDATNGKVLRRHVDRD